MKKTVIVGISGGVDSSVCAYLLKQDYNVRGVFMKNWSDENECTSKEDYASAQAACQALEIPLETVDFSNEYYSLVFQTALKSLSIGHTPNPDILCNKEIKFKAFLNYALQQEGADLIATGHYANIKNHQDLNYLAIPKDKHKDQTYFLYTLTSDVLAKVVFPLANVTKPKVREIAKQINLPNSSRKDSTGLCFIGPNNYKKFMQKYLASTPGDIVTEKGEVVGKHDGTSYYTIGQRKGLHIGGLKNHPEKPWYVIDKNTHQLIVSQNKHHDLLWKKTLKFTDLILNNPSDKKITKVMAKARYNSELALADVDFSNSTLTFDEKCWAITKGQAIVFYQDDRCLGGATII